LKRASRSRVKAMSSSSVIRAPGRSTTTASSVSPHFSDGMPMTAVSWTAGCAMMAFSTSAG
jgi:hypothetical protein